MKKYTRKELESMDFTQLSEIGDFCLRLGIAWRGDYSCDVDHSLNMEDKKPIYYGNPTGHNQEGEVIISSSGDITTCSNDKFSTELIDIDVALLKKTTDVTKMYNSAIMYSGKTFDTIECYWFMNVIKRTDRVLDNRKVTINLDEMQYAIKLQEPAKGQVGFTFDVPKMELTVQNIPAIHSFQYMNAANCEDYFQDALGDVPKRKSIYKALKSVISSDQLTTSITEADIIISADVLMPQDKTLHPGRDTSKLQEIIF